MPFSRLLLAAALLALAASAAHAQKQEQTMLDRINNPDLTLKFDPADKQFSARGAINHKTAAVRPYAFSKSANVRDGFRTQKFAGAKGFGTRDYAGNKEAAAGKRSFAQTDRSYATADYAVRDAREASKTLATRTYSNVKEPFITHGKAQGTFDYLMEQKNLDINQVRELLNKNQ